MKVLIYISLIFAAYSCSAPEKPGTNVQQETSPASEKGLTFDFEARKTNEDAIEIEAFLQNNNPFPVKYQTKTCRGNADYIIYDTSFFAQGVQMECNMTKPIVGTIEANSKVKMTTTLRMKKQASEIKLGFAFRALPANITNEEQLDSLIRKNLLKEKIIWAKEKELS